MSGFGPSANPSSFTIGASASVSNVIDGGGWALAGLFFPTGYTGTGFKLKEGLNSTAASAGLIYDSAAVAQTVSVPAAGSSAVMVKLDPTKYHDMNHVHLVASSAQSSAIIVTPLWTKYNAK